jgi:ribonuclease HII
MLGIVIKTGAVDRLALERGLLASGLARIAGVDEAGRGPLAGPVVAAAVILPADWIRDGLPPSLAGLNDSKQLTERQREQYFRDLTARPEVQQGVGMADAEEIDRINILCATHLAMNRALAMLHPPPDHALVDGRPVSVLRLQHTAVVKGDSLSYSIAAASVLAKVTRDRLMIGLDRAHPGYGFAVHKGYGTPQHLAALATLGPSPAHRRSFTWRKPGQMSLL